MRRRIGTIMILLAALAAAAAAVFSENATHAAFVAAVALFGGVCLALLVLLVLPSQVQSEERRRLDAAAADASQGRLVDANWEAREPLPPQRSSSRRGPARRILYYFAGILGPALFFSLLQPPERIDPGRLVLALLFAAAAAVLMWLRWDVAGRRG